MLTPSKLKVAIASALCLMSVSLNALSVESDKKPTTKPMPSNEFVFKYLAGEIAGQRGETGLSSNIFLDLAKSTRDARIAERAAKTAVQANEPTIAVEAVSLWSELAPDSTEAQQASMQMLIAQGKLQEAKPFLQKLLAKEDTRTNGFMYLNSLFNRQPNKETVLALVQELAKPYPSLPEAHFSIALAAKVANQNDLAITETEQADRLKPGWETAAILKGQVLFAQSQPSALAFFKTHLAQYPSNNEVRLTYARLLVNLKQLDEAKTQFVILANNPNSNPEMLVVVALLSSQSEDYANAEKYFKQALDKKFKDPDQIYYYLGQLEERQKHYAEAKKYYEQVAGGNHGFEAKLAIGNIIGVTQNANSAMAYLDDLHDLTNEQLARVIQLEASLLNQEKRYQEAYDLLDKAHHNLPEMSDLAYDLAMSAERLGKIDVSEKLLRQLIETRPDFPQAFNALGYSLADRNIHIDEAYGYIEKALSLSPNDFYILDSMGWVKYRQGKFDQALEYLHRAYAAQSDPEVAAHITEVLWHQGKQDEAIKTLENALQLFPGNEVLLKASEKFKR